MKVAWPWAAPAPGRLFGLAGRGTQARAYPGPGGSLGHGSFILRVILFGVTWAFLGCGPGPREASSDTPPNFVFILIDDMGWTDLGCFGSTFFETPHIDRLAQEGMKFTQAYSACTVCSPTRASILTGKYPARLHLTDWIPSVPEDPSKSKRKLLFPRFLQQLPLEELTLAKALKPAGYISGCIGKWHLGGPAFYPDKQGFAVSMGEKYYDYTYFAPYRLPGLEGGTPGEYLTDRESEEAVKFIESNKDRRFFLYLAHHAVHMPVEAKPEKIEKYRKKAGPESPSNNAVYAGMIESVDESVGRIVAKLKELGLDQNTVVVFTSDNGGLLFARNGSWAITSNRPLREGKGSAYEGGVRVPLIVRWPGRVPPGSVCDTPVLSIDFFPTFLGLAGQRSAPVDGESLVPLLRGAGGWTRTALYWHYPHYHPGGATPHSALRDGDYKLIEFFEDGRLELYNLKEDVGETRNLASTNPGKAQELRTKLERWRTDVGAQMPTPNPQFVPKEK